MYIRAHHCTRQQEILGDFTSNLSIRGENMITLGGSSSEDTGTDSDFFLQFFFCLFCFLKQMIHFLRGLVNVFVDFRKLKLFIGLTLP